MSAAVDVRHLRKEYRADGEHKIAVNDLCLTLEAGDIFGLLGPNGAGKTTTLKMLCGLIPPTSGTALIHGVDITRHPEQARSLTGYMPDVYGMYEDTKVWEYLDFYAAAYRIPRSQRAAVVANTLNLTDLTGQRQAYVSTLSRGMQQRLCLARALIHDPKVLLLDEPASGLDPRARVELRELFKELQTRGKTILVSSHILPEMEAFCNKIGILERGELMVAGEVGAIFRQAQARQLIEIGIVEEVERAERLLLSLPDLVGSARVTRGQHAHADAEREERRLRTMDQAASERGGTLEIAYVGAADEEYKVLTALVQAGIKVRAFHAPQTNLEDVFLKATGEKR